LLSIMKSSSPRIIIIGIKISLKIGFLFFSAS
jgi:hypothetical protein